MRLTTHLTSRDQILSSAFGQGDLTSSWYWLMQGLINLVVKTLHRDALPQQDWDPGPSHCEAIVLTTAPQRCPSFTMTLESAGTWSLVVPLIPGHSLWFFAHKVLINWSASQETLKLVMHCFLGSELKWGHKFVTDAFNNLYRDDAHSVRWWQFSWVAENSPLLKRNAFGCRN